MTRAYDILSDALELANEPGESLVNVIRDLALDGVVEHSEAVECMTIARNWVNDIDADVITRLVVAYKLTERNLNLKLAEAAFEQKTQSKKPMLSLVPNTNNQLAE